MRWVDALFDWVMPVLLFGVLAFVFLVVPGALLWSSWKAEPVSVKTQHMVWGAREKKLADQCRTEGGTAQMTRDNNYHGCLLGPFNGEKQ